MLVVPVASLGVPARCPRGAATGSLPAWAYLTAVPAVAAVLLEQFPHPGATLSVRPQGLAGGGGLLPEQRPFRFIDLGSGLGGVLFDLEQRFPQGRFVGTELAPAPWLISRVRAWPQGSRVAVACGETTRR